MRDVRMTESWMRREPVCMQGARYHSNRPRMTTQGRLAVFDPSKPGRLRYHWTAARIPAAASARHVRQPPLRSCVLQ